MIGGSFGAAAVRDTFHIGSPAHALLELEGVDFNKPLAEFIKQQLPSSVLVNPIKLCKRLFAIKPEPKPANSREEFFKINIQVKTLI